MMVISTVGLLSVVALFTRIGTGDAGQSQLRQRKRKKVESLFASKLGAA